MKKLSLLIVAMFAVSVAFAQTPSNGSANTTSQPEMKSSAQSQPHSQKMSDASTTNGTGTPSGNHNSKSTTKSSTGTTASSHDNKSGKKKHHHGKKHEGDVKDAKHS